jgi:hypothetical protein
MSRRKSKKPRNLLYDPSLHDPTIAMRKRKRRRRQPTYEDILECMRHGSWRRGSSGALKQVRWE